MSYTSKLSHYEVTGIINSLETFEEAQGAVALYTEAVMSATMKLENLYNKLPDGQKSHKLDTVMNALYGAVNSLGLTMHLVIGNIAGEADDVSKQQEKVNGLNELLARFVESIKDNP